MQRLLTLILKVGDEISNVYKKPHLLSLKMASALTGSTSETNKQTVRVRPGQHRQGSPTSWSSPDCYLSTRHTGGMAEGLLEKPEQLICDYVEVLVIALLCISIV